MGGLSFTKILLSIGIFLLTILPVSAANLLNTTFAGAQVFSSTGFLKIFPSGSFTQTFNASQAETVMISFSSVCSTSGTSDQFTSIQILLDGNPVYPTGKADDVLCSAVGAETNRTGLIRNSVVTAVSVSSGFTISK